MSVCVSHISKTTQPNLTKYFVHVDYGHDLILLWWCCNMLCSFSLVDDVLFHKMYSVVHYAYS